MNGASPVLTFEGNLSLAGRQFRWLAYFWSGVYLASLILTLSAVLWYTPTPWGWREVALIILVSFQVAHYWVWFAATHYPGWPLTWPWVIGHLLVSLGVWLIEWRLEAAFWWIIWMQVFQLYIYLPLKVAIPIAGLIFLVFAHFDSGLSQFFHFPVGEVIERLIPWVIVSMSFSAITFLNRANQERARLIAELQSANQRLEMARQQEVELAALREREHLAREMHDSLGHALVALSVQLEAVQRLYPINPEGALKQIDEMKTLTRTSMAALRRTLAGLRAPGLNHRPLAQALSELIQEINQRTPLEISCRVAPEVDQLSPAIAEALWRVIQEALMNVEKHAAAGHVQIDLGVRPEAVTLRVADDGIGLPPDYTHRPGHYGLQGMRERMEGLGGVLTLGNNDQAGTLIEAHLPLIGNNGHHGAAEQT
jgi:signal transduction histidine kinase